MLRISKLTDYATVLLAQLADPGSDRHTTAGLAARTRIGVPTVGKVLKALQHGGLVVSTRGAHGGYALARSAAAISAADIIDAVEGTVGLTDCSTEPGRCEHESGCRVGRSWQRVHVAIRRTLEGITLAELMSEPAARRPNEHVVAIGPRPASRPGV